jgi:hypothetical protein
VVNRAAPIGFASIIAPQVLLDRCAGARHVGGLVARPAGQLGTNDLQDGIRDDGRAVFRAR